jgi:hypothetical protein
MGKIHCPETSIKDYQSAFRNIPEEYRSQDTMKFKLLHIRANMYVSRSFRFAVLPSSSYLFTAGVEFVYFSRDHAETHNTVGRTPLDEGSARRRGLYLTTQTLYKRQTSMHPVGFEHTSPASAGQQTYASGRAATGIGCTSVTYFISRGSTSTGHSKQLSLITRVFFHFLTC